MPILPRHRPRRDAAVKPGAHAQVMSFDQLADHRDALGEVIAAVAITHQDIVPIGRLAPAYEGRAIAPSRYGNHARTKRFGKRLAAVGRTIVSDDDFTRQAKATLDHLQRLVGVGDTMRQADCFIEARHYDGHSQRLRPIGRQRLGTLMIHQKLPTNPRPAKSRNLWLTSP